MNAHPITLPDLVFGKEIYSLDPEEASQLIAKNIPKDLESTTKKTSSQACLILSSSLPLEKKTRALKRLILKSPKILTSTLKKLEELNVVPPLACQLAKLEHKSLLREIFQTLNPVELTSLLKANGYYFFTRLLLRKDVELLSVIPASILLNTISSMHLEHPGYLKLFLTADRILLLRQLYFPYVIDTTLQLFSTLLCEKSPPEGLPEVFKTHREIFESSFFNILCFSSPASLRAFPCKVCLDQYPELTTVATLVMDFTGPTQGFSASDLEERLKSLTVQDLHIILRNMPTLEFFQSRGILLTLLHNFEKDPETMAMLVVSDSRGYNPLLNLIMNDFVDPVSLKTVFPELVDRIETFARLNKTVDSSAEMLTEWVDPIQLQSPAILYHLLLRNNLIPQSAPGVREALDRIPLLLHKQILPYLTPLQLRDLFNSMDDLISKRFYEASFIITADDPKKSFRAFFTEFYVSNYNTPPRTIEEEETLRISFKENFSNVDPHIFFAIMTRPIYRNYIVDLAPYMPDSYIEVLLPLFQDGEVISFFRRIPLARTTKFLSLLDEAQKEYFLEYSDEQLTNRHLHLKSSSIEFLELQKALTTNIHERCPSTEAEVFLNQINQMMTTHKITLETSYRENICPLTGTTPKQPVRLVVDGKIEPGIYENQALLEWVLVHKGSPLTKQPVTLSSIQSAPPAPGLLSYFSLPINAMGKISHMFGWR
ncbi:MAG: hypothetical protein ACOYK9_04215 [Chlamydiia bacterium]